MHDNKFTENGATMLAKSMEKGALPAIVEDVTLGNGEWPKRKRCY